MAPSIDAPAVAVFFYGSYMNRAVLTEAGLTPHSWEVGSLAGFDIHIRPRANLVAAAGATVWGILATATHADLERLYAHARNVLGEVYLPHPVLVELPGGSYRPALCYISPHMEARPADRDYIERILAPAREHGFPADYLQRIERHRHRGDMG
jgi:cation transport regulator ChaC